MDRENIHFFNYIPILSTFIMLQMLRAAERPAFLTFVGTALVKFGTGVIGIWGTVNIYFFSYLKNNGTIINPSTNSLMLLCAIIPTSFAVLIATTVSKIFGYRKIIRISAVVYTLTPLVLNLKFSLFTLGVFWLLIPVSCFALSSIPILNCLWSQFPKDLNKVSGLAVLFFAVGMIVWNLIFMAICNPSNQIATIDSDNQAFFSDAVSNQIFKAINIVFISAGVCFMIGSLLITKRDQIDQGVDGVKKLEEESPPPQQNQCNLPEQNQNNPCCEQNEIVKIQIKDKQLLKKSLKDKKFILLFFISFLVPLYLVYLVMYTKLIYLPMVNDDHYLAYCSVVTTVAAIIGAPLWGFIGDKKGFKFTLLLVTVVDLLSKILGIFCYKKWNIILVYFMLGFNDKGLLTIIGPGLIEMFGLQLATELIPFKGLAIFLAYIVVPLIQIIFAEFFGYQTILILFTLCSGIAVGLSFHFYEKITYEVYGESQKSDEAMLDTKKIANQ